MKIKPPPHYEGRFVQAFTLPPSEVREFHPDAKAGEFYAACQNKETEAYWTLGPFKTREEADTAIRNEALKREDTGRLSSVEIVDERAYQMNKAGPDIVSALRKLSEEDAKICFDWALEQRRKHEP